MANYLTQDNLNIVSGQTYRLTFEADIDSGALQVLQGTQNIFDSRIIEIGIIHENVYIADKIFVLKINPIEENDSITVSENITLTIT